MLETAYVITWRWSDGSGSGATAAFVHKARADRLLEVLTADPTGRDYKIEAVPFDSASGVQASDEALPEETRREAIAAALMRFAGFDKSRARRVSTLIIADGVPEVPRG